MKGAFGNEGALRFLIPIACKQLATRFNPSTRIASHGLYRFTRNPMYIGFALWTLGLATLVDSAWVLLAAPIGVALTDRIVIMREERYLERKFGEEYLSSKRRVRRWI